MDSNPDQDELFGRLPGGQQVLDWFGFVPTFHDASLRRIEITSKSVVIEIEAFRMTSEVDAKGYFVLDRHALVTLRCSSVTGISLRGSATGTIILQLNIQKIGTKPPDWDQYDGPEVGDYEVKFDSACGFDGSIFGRELSFELVPLVLVDDHLS